MKIEIKLLNFEGLLRNIILLFCKRKIKNENKPNNKK